MGDINTSQSFSAGDLVTDTKLNNIAQLSVLSVTAITEKSAKTTAPSESDRLLIFESSSNQLKKISLNTLINVAPLTQTLPANTSNTFGTSAFPQGSAASPSVRASLEASSGLFWSGDGLGISAQGVQKARFGSTATTLVGPVTVSGSLSSNGGSTGQNNTSFGVNSLGSASSADSYSCTAFGAGALRGNTTGDSNTAVGVNALTTNSGGINNTAVGVNALTTNSGGVYNTAVGLDALAVNTAHYNTAVGANALTANTTGETNTAIGMNAGSEHTIGSGNTFIGYGAQGLTTASNNTITLGSSNIGSLRCQAQLSNLSDRRDKKDIVSLASGLGLIQELRPVSFVWNMRDGGKVGQPEIGFIAQELQEAQAKSGLSVPHLVNDENPEKLEAAFATLIPVLVRAVQELSDKVRQLEQRLP